MLSCQLLTSASCLKSLISAFHDFENLIYIFYFFFCLLLFLVTRISFTLVVDYLVILVKDRTTLLTKHNSETTIKLRVDERKEEYMQKRDESRRKKKRLEEKKEERWEHKERGEQREMYGKLNGRSMECVCVACYDIQSPADAVAAHTS